MNASDPRRLSLPVETYPGAVREVDLGGSVVGGAEAFPFNEFDGKTPHDPCIAFEVWDVEPEDWAPDLQAVYANVWASPEQWARYVSSECGADALYLKLRSADPFGKRRPVSEVVKAAVQTVEAAGLPAIIVGCGHPDVDVDLMPRVAEAFAGRRVTLGPGESDTYRVIGGAARDHGHAVLAYTPMDVSLAKQLNVLLGQMGVPDEDIVMDPTCAALGYSFEYAYSVLERDRLAALAQNDVRMQAPILVTIGQETWHTKEARADEKDLPGHGDRTTRAVLWEAIGGVCLMLAGADVLVVRHPAAAGLVRQTARLLRGAPVEVARWD